MSGVDVSAASWPVVGVTQRDLVWVRGKDAVSFLQGQLSVDVEAIEPRYSGWSLLLQPNGKLVAWLRVSRTGDDEVLLDVDPGWGSVVEARLRRFVIRVAVEMEAGGSWPCLSVRGPGAAAIDYPSGAVVVSDPQWPGLEGLDLLGPDLSTAGVPSASPIDAAELDSLRVLCGVPAMGVDVDDETIPAEAGKWLIDASVSFTKGCYTGQELVARVDSRGSNTPHHLRRLRFGDEAAPATGDEVAVAADGERKVVGRLGSVARTRFTGGPVALAMLHRSVEPGAKVAVSTAAGEVTAVVASEA